MFSLNFKPFILVNLICKPIFPMVNIDDNPLYYASIGGLIIGIATSLNYVLRGSVTGMSGMLYSTVTLDKSQMPKNLAIIGGMLLIGGIFFDVFEYGTFNRFTPFGPAADITIATSQLGFALAGILVGFGTKLSNGCTSGHGLCGLARFSIRSLVAVITFLISGLAIATIAYHAGGLGPFTEQQFSPVLVYNHSITANISIVLGVLLPLAGLYLRLKVANEGISELKSISGNDTSRGQQQSKSSNQFFYKDQIILFLVGFIFGTGLLVAGMVRRTNIIGFLALGKDWNPSLMFVLGCGLAVNLVFFTYMLKVRKEPLFGGKLFNPNNPIIDLKLVGGAICFGLGWGIGGLCPGPTIMQTPIFTIDVHMIWLPFFFLGQFIANKLNQVFPSQPITVQQNKGEKLKDLSKEKPNSIIEDSQIIVRPMMSQNQQFKGGFASPQKQDHIAEILHEHGPGYTHAHKLPQIQSRKNFNQEGQLNENLMNKNLNNQPNSGVIIENIH